jgi:PAS domain S-box-containing protein
MASTKPLAEKNGRASSLIEENIKLLDQLIKQLIDGSSKKLLVISDNKIVYANPMAIKALGINHKDNKEIPVNEVLYTAQGGTQLSHYLGMSASLKKTFTDNDPVKIMDRNGKEQWFSPSLRRCFWKGKSSVILALNDIDYNRFSTENEQLRLQRKRLALKASNQCIWDLNLGNNQLYICSDFFAMLGFKPQESEVTLSTWQKYLHNDSVESFKKLLDSLKSGLDLPSFWEYRVLNKDNQYKWFVALWQVVEWDSFSKPLRVIGIHMNIDDRKRAEIEREEYQKMLIGFIGNSLDGLVIIDEKGIVKEWNPVQEQITQISRKQMIDQSIWEIHQSQVNSSNASADYIGELKEIFATLTQTGQNPWEGKVVDSKLRINSKKDKLLQHTVFTIKTQNGIKIAITVKDVTESETYRIKVAKSEERLKLALAAGNVGIWDIDFVTEEQYFSPMTFTIFGYRPWEVTPGSELWKSMIHPDDLDWVLQKIKEFNISGTALEIEFRMKKKDGTYIWVLSKNRILRDDQNKTLRVTGTISDITRQKNIETELRQNEEFLKKNIQQHEVISEISFILNTNKSLQEKNQEVLALLGSFTNSSRVYIFEDKPKEGITVNTYEWCNEGIEPQIQNLQHVSLSMVSKMTKGKDHLSSHDLEKDLPPDFLKMMIDQGIQSFITFPLQVSGKVFGFIGFDECTSHRIWEKHEVELLKAISNLISFSYERQLISEHYQQNEERYRELTEMLPQIIFEVSPKGRIDFLNQTGCNFFGVTKEKVKKGVYVWDLFPSRTVLKMRQQLESFINSNALEPITLEVKQIDKNANLLTIYIRPRMVNGEIVNFSGVALQP